MPFQPLIISGIECILNTLLYCNSALNIYYQRLNGKTLRISLKDFIMPIILNFSEHYIGVSGEWNGEINCSIIVHTSIISKLHSCQQLPFLIKNRTLEIEGDLQVLQNFVSLLDAAKFDPVEILSQYIGDIAAEVISRALLGSYDFLRKVIQRIQRHKRYFAEFVTEELRMTPGSLEVLWFIEETTAVDHAVESLAKRIKNWRKNDSR